VADLGDAFALHDIWRFHGGGPGDPGEISRIGDSDRFGMLVLDMMCLCVNLFMFLEVLWSLERFLADLERRETKN
jgi:hypothetical protein